MGSPLRRVRCRGADGRIRRSSTWTAAAVTAECGERLRRLARGRGWKISVVVNGFKCCTQGTLASSAPASQLACGLAADDEPAGRRGSGRWPGPCSLAVVPANLPGLPAKNLTVYRVLTCLHSSARYGPWRAVQCCCSHSQRSCRHHAACRATLQRATISATQHAWLAR